MTLQAHLQVVDLTATFRGDDPDRPVHVGYDGTRVVMLLDPKHAELAAQMLARVASNALEGDEIDQDLWIHVAVDLVASATMAGPIPTPVQVPPLEALR